MRVTAIERQRRNRRVNLHLDGRFAIGLSLDTLARVGLRIGDTLDEARLDELRAEETRVSAMASALRLLSYRPRSERELRQRLERRKVPPEVIEGTLARLRELRLVDDAAFAHHWASVRANASPRSARVVRAELTAKGVPAETAKAATESLDEREAALRAGERKARTLAGQPLEVFQRRLSEHLLRRGFDFETARSAVRELAPEPSA